MLALLVTGGRKLELWYPLSRNARACETVPKDGAIKEKKYSHTSLKGARGWRSWLRHYATSRKVAGSVVSLEFFVDIIFPDNRHEQQENFVGRGVKAAGA